MKALKLSLFASAMMLGSFTMTAQTADEVMTKHIAAMGGDSWGKITSMKTSSTMSVQGMELEINETKAKGKGARSEMLMGGQSAGYKIVTPTGGWQFSAMQGDTEPKALSADEVKASQEEINITHELANYKSEGAKTEYIGKEDVNGKPAHKLKIKDSEGNEVTVYFDAASYYKIRDTRKVEAQGQSLEITTDYSDFKKFPEGIVVAMKAKNDYQEINVKSVELNKPVDEAIFKPSN